MIDVVNAQAVYGHGGYRFRNGDIGIHDRRFGLGESEDILASNGSGVNCLLLRCRQQSEAVANLQPVECINGGTVLRLEDGTERGVVVVAREREWLGVLRGDCSFWQ